jgi:hypothetical protein
LSTRAALPLVSALVRPIALALVIVTLGGCTAGAWLFGAIADSLSPVSGWSKPGASEEDVRRDRNECDAAALKEHGPGPAAHLAYERCMRHKGYELAEK